MIAKVFWEQKGVLLTQFLEPGTAITEDVTSEKTSEVDLKEAVEIGHTDLSA